MVTARTRESHALGGEADGLTVDVEREASEHRVGLHAGTSRELGVGRRAVAVDIRGGQLAKRRELGETDDPVDSKARFVHRDADRLIDAGSVARVSEADPGNDADPKPGKETGGEGRCARRTRSNT